MNNFTQLNVAKSGRKSYASYLSTLGLLLVLLVSSLSFGQNAIVGTGFSNGWGGGSCPTGNTNFKFMAANIGTTYSVSSVANGTGNQYLRFGVDWSGTTAQLAITPGTDVLISPNITYNLNTSCTVSGSQYINVGSTSYNYIFKTLDAGTNPTGTFTFFEVQGTVQSITSVYQNAVIAGSATTITANLSGAFATGQAAYLRYSTDNFATSSVVQMTGSGTVYTADIPAAANVANNTVKYYVFTSGTANVASNGSNADLYTINYNNNSGANYSYVVNAFGDAFTRATLNPGGNPSYTYTPTLATGATATISGNSFLNIAAGGTSGVSQVAGLTSSYGNGYNTTLSSNSSTPLITWTFNMRWNRASSNNPAPPASGSYGQAVVLAGSSASLSSGTGYAIVYGSTSTPDPIRLVRYSGGVTGTLTDICTSAANDLSATNNYASVRVTYAPSTNTWSLFVRDDGASAWADPTSGVTSQKGSSTVDNTYTGTALANMGYLWTHGAGTDSGQFDNFRCNIGQVVAPTISGISVAAPGSGTSGYVGSTVTVTGTGFTGVTSVKVGGTTVSSFTVVSDTSITFPAIAASGTVYVQNTAGNYTSSASYTDLGYITKATGTWQTAATWLGGAVPPSATTTAITIAHNVTGTTGTINVGSLTVNTGITLTNTAAATINVNTASTNSGTITNNGTFAVAATYTNSGTFTVGNGGTFQLNNSGFFTGTAIAYNTTASALTFNTTAQYLVVNTHAYWPATNGPVTVNLAGSGGVQIQTGTTRTVTNIILSAGLDIQSANLLTVSGTLTMNNGGFITSNSPVYGSASTLLYNSTVGYGVNNEWTGNATTVGAGTPFNVTLTSSSVNMPNGARSLVGNLVIGSGSTLTLNTNSGADLNIGGNWTNSGTFVHNSRAVQFRGSAAQTITGATTFAYLTLNNSAGVTLANAVTVANQLDFQAGKLTLGANNLTMSSGATITNVSATKYIATTSTGQLLATSVGATALTFPVGNSAYNPITFTNSGTADTFGVRVVDGALTTPFDPTKTVSRRWLVSEVTAGGSILSVVGQYNTGEENTNYNAGTNPYIGFYNGTSWAQVSSTLSGSNPYISTASATISPASLNGTQYFALGKDNAFLSIATNLVITSITPTSPTAGSGFSVTVRSQDAYGSFSNVFSSTAFSLTTNGAAGTIGGTVTGTLAAGTNTVTVSGVTLSTAGTGATLTATRTSGDVLSAGTSSAFNVLAPASQLVIVNAPTTGFTGTNLTSFTIEARRPDNSLDTTFTGNITISKASGPGVLSGTTTVAAVAGVATFSAAQFDTAGTVTITASSGSLTTATSGNIVISLVPVMIYKHDFEATTATPFVAIPPIFDSHLSSSSWSNKNGTGTFIASNGNGNTGNSLAVSTIANTPYTLTFNVANGYSVDITSFNLWRFSSQSGNTISSITINGTTITSGSISVPTGSNASSGTTLGQTNVANSVSGLTGTITVVINLVNGGNGGSFRLDDFTLYGNVTCVQPVAYTVTGGGNGCASTGVVVGLSNSQVGVSYQLKNGVTNVGSPVAGTGSAISFGNQTTAATYTVVASNTNGTCNYTLNMTGSATITLDPVSVAGSVSADQSICTGTQPSDITLTGYTGTIQWQSSTDNSVFTPISGATSNTLLGSTIGVLSATRYYRAIVTSGICSSSTSGVVTIVVNPNHTVALTSGSSTPTLCQNTALATPIVYTVGGGATGAGVTGLPTGMNGTFSGSTLTLNGTPSVSGTFNYTVTTTGNTCTVATATGTITVNAPVTPTFTAVSPICSGASLSALPTTSNNGITGTWSPALDNTTTTTYTFTPTAGQCATTATLTITVNPNVTPTFTAVAPICSGASLSALPTTSNNGITGTWSPTLDNTATTTYTFTPDSGQCATTATLTITVNANVTPTFTAVSPICSGASLSTLPTTSNNGITGTWSPALDNTATTTYTFTPTAGQCATTATLTITVNPNVTPTFTSVSPICSGATLSALPTTSNNGITGTWSPALDNTATTTYTFTPTAGQCATTATLTITVNPNVTPTFTSVSPICSGATLSALPTTSNNGITGTWSPALDNTTTTTYTFTPDSGQCATTATLTITVGATVTWDGSAWSNVSGPTSTDAVVFTGNYTVTGTDLNACSVTVSNNAVVSVASGYNLNLNGSVTVSSGSLTLNNNANLYQADANAVNTGNIVVKRNTNPLIRLDYTMWSSPVAGQGLLAFSPLTTITPTIRFYTYNTSTNLYNSVASPSTTNFATGTGYLIRVPYNHPTAPAIWTGSFTGVPNNGTQTVGLSYIDATHSYNAVGNPYPSPISISQFATDNASSIEPTLYFWRKTNNAANQSYCTWNTTSNTFVTDGEAYATSPNGVIQTGQGFIVQAKSGANSLVFNNTQRVVNNANQFFRTSAAAATTTNEAHRIWLNLSGTGAEFSQTAVGYFSNATLGADDYDSKFFNDGNVSLNTKLGTEAYAVQGRPVPFDATDVVPLNYKVTTAGTYTFAIDHVDGLFTGGAQTIYIKDNTDGSYHDITTTPYSFTSAAGTFDTRFELVYQNGLLQNNQNTFNANSIDVIHQSNNDVVVRTGTATMATVQIFDIRGRLLVEQKGINASETRVNVGTTNQVLLVQVTTTEGYRAVRKVVN